MTADLDRKARIVTTCDRCGAQHRHKRGTLALPAGWTGTEQGADYCPECTEVRRDALGLLDAMGSWTEDQWADPETRTFPFLGDGADDE